MSDEQPVAWMYGDDAKGLLSRWRLTGDDRTKWGDDETPLYTRPAQPATPTPDMAGEAEKVARAIWEARCDHWGKYRDQVAYLSPWDELSESKQREVMREAKAALAALENRNG